MPNHCINELIFTNVDAETQARILSLACNADGQVDFNILVPAPSNLWGGSVGESHRKAFGALTHLDWAPINWGTKWNAYDHHPIEQTDSTLTLRFETAWRPPYPWLAAVLNTTRLSFHHNWLSEGGSQATHGVFVVADAAIGGDLWRETPADDPLGRHLHKLLWGVEAFDEDEGAKADAQ